MVISRPNSGAVTIVLIIVMSFVENGTCLYLSRYTKDRSARFIVTTTAFNSVPYGTQLLMDVCSAKNVTFHRFMMILKMAHGLPI
jgi:hypothetical protein